jgi:hypothetical protein
MSRSMGGLPGGGLCGAEPGTRTSGHCKAEIHRCLKRRGSSFSAGVQGAHGEAERARGEVPRGQQDSFAGPLASRREKDG